MLPGSGDVGHVFVQDIFLGADAVILDVLGPVQLAHVEVKSLQDARRQAVKFQPCEIPFSTTRWRERRVFKGAEISVLIVSFKKKKKKGKCLCGVFDPNWLTFLSSGLSWLINMLKFSEFHSQS